MTLMRAMPWTQAAASHTVAHREVRHEIRTAEPVAGPQAVDRALRAHRLLAEPRPRRRRRARRLQPFLAHRAALLRRDRPLRLSRDVPRRAVAAHANDPPRLRGDPAALPQPV